MPGKVKVRVLSGRNLPVMDRSSDTTDAFVEVRLGVTTYKTDVCRKTLNPVWNSEWFRFDVDDLELQDEPLTIRVMDYDTYSANDAIGKVYIDLNPLLWPSSPSPIKKDPADGSNKDDISKHPGGTMCGWLHIFDTMHGIRGEIQVQVKVELFSDLNRYRQSSCGVQFFRTNGVPEGYRVQYINGFVEELVMNNDPEYQWIDKIRTPRASNEARQTLFLKLSGIIQRKIGLKALELGGNAVLGYQQKFDLESDNIVVRGIGTAVTLSTATAHKDLAFKDKTSGSMKRARSSEMSFANLSEELKRISNHDLQFHRQLLDPSFSSSHPSDIGIASALAVTAAVIKVMPKTVESVVSGSKPWYRKTSFREAAKSIKSVSAGLSAGNSPGSSFKSKPKQQLYHHRVSSLKLDDGKPGNGVNESNVGTMAKTNSQSVPLIQCKPVNLTQNKLTPTESFSSVVTSPSTDSSLAPSSSLEQLQPQQEKLIKTLKNIRKEESLMYKPEFNVTKEENERAIFDLGSDDEDDDTESVINVDDAIKSPDTTCPVTLLNTLLNANIHQTTEGDAIRKQLAADPAKNEENDDAEATLTASDSRIFTDQRPILTVEPPSPMPSFSLPDPNLVDMTNSNGEETYDSINTSYTSINSRRVQTGDANNTVTFSHNDASQKLTAVATNYTNTCSCNVVGVSNKNKLTVPVMFDLMSLNLSKLSGERKACQRSHSTSGHDQRRKVPAKCTVSGARCSSLSPANSFRSILSKRQPNNVPVRVANNHTKLSSPPLSNADFHRSLEADLIQKLEDFPRNELDRPSPDQDLGCSPRGYNLIHATSEKHVGVQRYSNRVGMTQESLELLEYPFITLKRFPRGFIHRFGGLVSCRSVKLLDGLQEDDDTRDIWWQDIRKEVRSHARSLGCNIIVGYTEDSVIWEDIIILCASGTAVVGNLTFMMDLDSIGIFGPPFKPNNAVNVGRTKSDAGPAGCYSSQPTDCSLSPPLSGAAEGDPPPQSRFQCTLVHIPYADISLPYACKVSKCRTCARGPVPDVLISTVEPPNNLEIQGRGCLMQATVVRLKKDLKGENNAREISDALPFVEYEIHRQLLNKMRVKGMNALFDVKFHVTVNDRTIVALATATGFFVAALPTPRPPKLQQARGGDEQYLQKMQLRLETKFADNMKYYGTEKSHKLLESSNGSTSLTEQNNDDSEIDLDTDGLEADLSSGNKDTCILEIDDSEDVDILDSLMEYYPPPWIQVMSTEEIVGLSPGHIVRCCQTFSQLVIQKINPTSRDLSTALRRLMNSLYFRLRRLKPCILCSIEFKADLNEENELQIAIYGSVIGLAHGGKTREELAKELESLDDEDLSSLQADKKSAVRKVDSGSSTLSTASGPLSTPSTLKGSGRNNFYSDTKEGQHIVTLTPLSYVPGAKIEKYLGSLNFFLIRETSSLREVGGLNTFVQSFICEIYSIVRAHVSCLGGNALVSFFISDLVVMPSVHKNQAQCLVHAGGDTVQITYLPPIETNTKS